MNWKLDKLPEVRSRRQNTKDKGQEIKDREQQTKENSWKIPISDSPEK